MATELYRVEGTHSRCPDSKSLSLPHSLFCTELSMAPFRGSHHPGLPIIVLYSLVLIYFPELSNVDSLFALLSKHTILISASASVSESAHASSSTSPVIPVFSRPCLHLPSPCLTQGDFPLCVSQPPRWPPVILTSWYSHLVNSLSHCIKVGLCDHRTQGCDGV